MTKDYKNVPRSADEKRKKERRTSANTKPKAKTKETKRTPGWVLLLVGTCVGGTVVGGGMYLFNGMKQNTTPAKVTVIEKKTEPAKQQPKVEVDTEEEEQRFDFYTLLPKLEVIIPESEIREEQEKLKPKEDVSYMIQVGSFRNFVDADALKAQLAFLGIEAEIEAISSKGETWQRVRVGPFTEKRELNRIRNRLHSNDYNTMLVKIRKDKS